MYCTWSKGLVLVRIMRVCGGGNSPCSKEAKEVYEGEVTELTPCETESPVGGYGKTVSHVVMQRYEAAPV